MEATVAVVGSVNVDTSFTLAALPVPGETAIATGTHVGVGGKGANQAVSAAADRAVRSHLIAAVGADQGGTDVLSTLKQRGVGTEHVLRVADAPTGRAYVSVDAKGENSIVVIPGANAALTATHVGESLEQLLAEQSARLVIACQGEIPAHAIDEAARFAVDHAVRFILNLAPVRSVSLATLRAANPLVLNEQEASELNVLFAGEESRPWPLERVAGALHRVLRVNLIITRGATGVLLVDRLGVTADVPGVAAARVVDTTGAGDAFVGALAAGLARAVPLIQAVEAGLSAGARAVEARGANVAVLTTGSGT